MTIATGASAIWKAEAGAYEPAARLGYIKELDGLRAFSALLVVIYHTLPTKLPGAFIGVDVFFVISGFLITQILSGEIERTRSIRLPRFYWRRLLRLGPALWTMVGGVLLALAVGVLVLHRTPPFPAAGEGWSALFAVSYVINWTRAFGILPDSMFGHAWSLAIEQQFYILWPALLLVTFRVFGREGAWKPVLALLVLAVAWRTFLVADGASPQRVYNGFDTRADTLLAGCLLALVASKRLGAPALRWIGIPIAIMGAITFVAHYDGYLSQLLGFTATMLCAAWIVLGTLRMQGRGPLSALLCWGPVNYLGRISYGFYLWHFPVAVSIGQTFGGGLPNLLITSVLSFALASLSFHLVEEPVMRWGRKA